MTDSYLAVGHRQVLATDLDGTLIPLEGNRQNQADLEVLGHEIEQNGTTLVFVTGRHLASVLQAIEEVNLPAPDWIICDVGTSIFQRGSSGEYVSVSAYEAHLREIIAAMSVSSLREHLQRISGLRLQEQEKQGRFKLSYYAEASQLDRLLDEIQRELDQVAAPFSIIHSVDPFQGDGLIDFLPAQVSKAFALQWWSGHAGFARDDIVFAGDSGNDLAALTAGYRAIAVANAPRDVVQRVFTGHQTAGWKKRLFIAREEATSGVLSGCRWFELMQPRRPSTFGLGAMPISYDQTHFRVWAPHRKEVCVELTDGDANRRRHPLMRDEDGYFHGNVSGTSAAVRYSYVLDGQMVRPDPAARYQPDGVHGASQIIQPDAFPWTDRAWSGVRKRELIIYELHIGSFTNEGTFRAAMERLPELVALGVTAVEIMPVAQSPGRWNWGYDGVNLFAVRNTYGEPDDLKAFVNACHSVGLAVILDVVYNHVGPEGNYLADFGPYFSSVHRTPWGQAFNFDGPNCQPVRRFVIENALRWLEEYHLDGLRLDAVHFMCDNSNPSILQELRAAITDYAATAKRVIHLIAESNVYDQELVSPEADQLAYDATWCDCLMHSIYTHALPDLQLSHRVYQGSDDLAEVLEHGFLYSFDGSGPVRVTAHHRLELEREAGRTPIESFVTALQTHDSVGNHPQGKRLHQLTSKAYQRAAAALTLLYPSIPLIFMGEECASDSVFPFFADFEDPDLRQAVDQGRAREYPQHVWNNAVLPSDPTAYYAAKCQSPEKRDEDVFAWYRSLIALRKRGLAEGWLTPSALTTEHRADYNLFLLQFAGQDGTRVEIYVRLTGADRNPVPATTSIAVAGELLLSSEPAQTDGDGQLLLRPNHAVITRCGGGSKQSSTGPWPV